jgi:hypothetical protein
MAVEQKWLAVPPRLFTANGSNLGIITIADDAGFKVKQRIVICATGLPSLQVQVKRVICPGTIIVGPLPEQLTASRQQGSSLLSVRSDISAYTVALGAFVYAEEQDKSKLKPDDIWQAVYDQEPTVALRHVMVDECGNYYTPTNPLPVAIDTSISIGAVEIKDPQGDILDVNTDGSINVVPTTVTLDPFIENITTVLANTEYSFTFPTDTRHWIIKNRGDARTQFAFNLGDSGIKFMTLWPGAVYHMDVNFGGKKIYFQTSKPNQVIEILHWTKV